MAIKTHTNEIEVTSEHMGYLLIRRHTENGIWMEITGNESYPLVLQTDKDFDDLINILHECKKYLKE